MIDELTLANLHQRQQQFDKSCGHIMNPLSPRRPHPRALDPRRVFARQIERAVRDHIEGLGFAVAGTSHKQNYDLLVQGLRVEIKAAHWDGRRYQAQMRANQADVLILCCLDGQAHYFVIPFDQVRGKTVVEINRHDPRDITTRWLRYYEAWDILSDLIAAGRNAWQPALMCVA